MALTTLRKMAAGGMHDHVGGGFHRYSVDEFWHIPHFEKMMCAPLIPHMLMLAASTVETLECAGGRVLVQASTSVGCVIC